MTLDEKLDVFYQSSIEDATKRSEEIISEYKESLHKMYEEHREKAEQKAAFYLEAETQKLLQEKNKTLSAETMDYKKRYSEKTEELKAILFKQVELRLISFMKTEDYVNLLVRQIESEVKFAGNDRIIIYINPTDEHLKSTLEQKTKAALTISSFDFMGGTRAVIQEKNILIDHSFSTKLAEEKDIFSL